MQADARRQAHRQRVDAGHKQAGDDRAAEQDGAVQLQVVEEVAQADGEEDPGDQDGELLAGVPDVG